MRLSRCMTVMLAACAGPVAANGPAAPGLCGAQETAFFACPVARGRFIGLCGSTAKALQYRFGRVGAVELQLPDSAAAGADRMLFAHYSRYQTDRVEVRFENQGSEYLIFDYVEDGRRRAGVRVTMPDAKEREIACTGRATSRLVELESVLKCDADSALNGGKCP
jgi:hypothetical protein